MFAMLLSVQILERLDFFAIVQTLLLHNLVEPNALLN